MLLGSGIANVLASSSPPGALYYLFRATRHRRPRAAALVPWLLVVAPVLIAVAAIANWVSMNDASESTPWRAMAEFERAS